MTFLSLHKKLIMYTLLLSPLSLHASEKSSSLNKNKKTQQHLYVMGSNSGKLTQALSRAVTTIVALEINNKIAESIYCPDNHCWQKAIACKEHRLPHHLRCRLLPTGILEKISQFLGSLSDVPPTSSQQNVPSQHVATSIPLNEQFLARYVTLRLLGMPMVLLQKYNRIVSDQLQKIVNQTLAKPNTDSEQCSLEERDLPSITRDQIITKDAQK